jgi:type I restriction enzyme, S subunit
MNTAGNERTMRIANNYVDDEAVVRLKAKPLTAGSVIFPKIGAAIATNKKRLLDRSSLVDNNVMGVWSTDPAKLLNEFLYYWLISVDLRSLSASGPLPSIAQSTLLKTMIPLPPVEEQRAIAGTLRNVEKVYEASTTVIATTRELERSLMDYLFRSGAQPVGDVHKARLRKTPIGWMPKEWRLVTLGEICHKPQYGVTASASSVAADARLLRITDLHDGAVAWNKVPYFDGSEAVSEKYRLAPGDIVIARIGATTGKSYLVADPPNAVFASYLIRIRVKDDIRADYLAHWMNSRAYWAQVDAAKGGRLKLGVNIPVLTNLQVPLPPLNEQAEIARVLDAVDKKVSAERSRRSSVSRVFRSVLTEVIRHPSVNGKGQRG